MGHLGDTDQATDGRAQLDALPEDIRLVIWDLDDTFWQGTLSEGGIDYQPQHDEIVRMLARRGIVSSICSKNHRAGVEAAFTGKPAWDHFVFPLIDWEAKGPKLKALIDTIQLRPQSVLFVDDNPMMRREALHFVPGLNVASDAVIPLLAEHPRFRGKPDPELTRLAQYRLLEQRHADRAIVDGDTRAFLKASGITVSIDHDVEANIDRAVELINRTNQLNFTKRRLPEDPAAARADLLAVIGKYDVQSALVRVRDRYGEYGYVGFYAQRQSVHPGSGLIHFAFSCRTLGMKIETWLYRRLGRPPIDIAGDVVADILDEHGAIDWIDIANPDAADAPLIEAKDAASELTLRGGCELLAVSHYCGGLAGRIGGVFATNRDSIQLRLEHSTMVRHTLEPPAPAVMESFRRLGFRDADFEQPQLSDPAEDAIWLLSFWGDAVYPLYRHKVSGALIPFTAFPAASPFIDLTTVPIDVISPAFRDHWVVDAVRHLAEDYAFVGVSGPALFSDNLRAILARLPSHGRAVIVGANEWEPADTAGIRHPRNGPAEINTAICATIAGDPRISFLAASDYLEGDHEIDDRQADHYVRTVYHRIFAMVRDRLAEMKAPGGSTTP